MSQTETTASWIGLAVVALFVVIARIQLIDIPLERDDGAYAYFGQVILDGGAPYQSFHEIKPPGVYYAYAAVLATFGATTRGLHAGFLVINVITLLLLFAIGRKLSSPLAGLAVAASFAIFSLIQGASGFTAQSEHLVAALVVAALLATLHAIDTERLGWLVASGLLGGAACTVKQNAIFFLVASIASVAAAAWLARRRLRRVARDVGAFVAGVAVIGTLVLVAMAAQGVLRELWFWSYEFPLDYVQRLGWRHGWPRFVRMLGRITEGHLALWGLAAVGSMLLPFARLCRARAAAIALFALAALLSVIPGWRFYPHYALQVMPASAILVGVAIEVLRRLLIERRRWSPERAALAAAGLLGIVLAGTAIGQRGYYFDPDYTAILRKVYHSNPFPEAKVVGDFLARSTEPGDQVAVFGSEPELYFYSGRRCPSSHVYFEYTVTDHPRQARWLAEFIRDVEAGMPRYLVQFQNPGSLGGDVDSEALDEAWRWFSAFATRDYRLVGLADSGSAGTEYVWGPEAASRKRKGDRAVYVFERTPAKGTHR